MRKLGHFAFLLFNFLLNKKGILFRMPLKIYKEKIILRER